MGEITGDYYFLGKSRPSAQDQTARSGGPENEFSDEQLKKLNFKDMPICRMHNAKVVIGKIIDNVELSSESGGKYIFGVIYLDNVVGRYTYENEIMTGKKLDLSLSHMYSEYHTKKDGINYCTKTKTPYELSVVDEGNFPGCSILFGDIIKTPSAPYISSLERVENNTTGSVTSGKFNNNKKNNTPTTVMPTEKPTQEKKPETNEKDTKPAELKSVKNNADTPGLSAEEQLKKMGPEELQPLVLRLLQQDNDNKKLLETYKQDNEEYKKKVDEESQQELEENVNAMLELYSMTGGTTDDVQQYFEEVFKDTGVEGAEQARQIVQLVASNHRSAKKMIEGIQEELEKLRSVSNTSGSTEQKQELTDSEKLAASLQQVRQQVQQEKSTQNCRQDATKQKHARFNTFQLANAEKGVKKFKAEKGAKLYDLPREDSLTHNAAKQNPSGYNTMRESGYTNSAIEENLKLLRAAPVKSSDFPV